MKWMFVDFAWEDGDEHAAPDEAMMTEVKADTITEARRIGIEGEGEFMGYAHFKDGVVPPTFDGLPPWYGHRTTRTKGRITP